MKKRVLSLALAVVMCLGMLPGMALAADSDFVIENGVLTKYTGPGGDVVIPDSVTSIDWYAFYGCDGLTSVTIPDSVTYIGFEAFAGCKNLTQVTLPDGIDIGEGAYKGCRGLASIEIPQESSIGHGAFAECTNLSHIVIWNGVTGIGVPYSQEFLDAAANGATIIFEDHDMFEHCTNLTNITIPKSVTYIDSYAFRGLDDLTIHGVPGSYAEIYAAEYGISFAAIQGKGTPLTIENEMYGISVTFDSYLRTETHSYRFSNDGGDTYVEREYTFYVVEDNSAVHIQALPGRAYNTGNEYPDYSDGDDWDMYAWDTGWGLDWRVGINAFTGGHSSDPEALTGPVTEIATRHDGDFALSDRYEGKQYAWYLCESDFERLVPVDQAEESEAPTAPAIPESGTSYTSTQAVSIDGKEITFHAYALRDENGNDTNFVRLRDIAAALNGTAGQFSVGYDEATDTISLQTGKAYTVAGGELTQIFTGNQAYKASSSPLMIDGKLANLTAITLTDANGGESNYFKLRDLGQALGFNVGYNDATGIFIETDKDYTDAD